MSDSNIVTGYAQALFEVARAEGNLSTVSDELYRFARAFEGSDALRSTLTDGLVPPAKRQSVVEDLLGGKASTTTVALISFVVGAGRGRELPAIIDRLVGRAASSEAKVIAEVRSAIALTPDQQARLTTALQNATGKTVELKVIIDESIKGGLVAQVGDTVIDGSVRRRLDQLKSLL
ncbi:MAG: ATP synthase F1 subunit delta [Acidimicrobiia bacterium]